MKNWIEFLEKFISELIIDCIKTYQKTFSPDHGMFSSVFLNFRCRFYPSCSDYALDSIRQYGLLRGVVLFSFRILKCNPFNKGGYDPVK